MRQLEWECLQLPTKINEETDKRDKWMSERIRATLLELGGQVPVPPHQFMFLIEREIVNDLNLENAVEVQPVGVGGRFCAKVSKDATQEHDDPNHQ
jgi:hypothetical protein